MFGFFEEFHSLAKTLKAFIIPAYGQRACERHHRYWIPLRHRTLKAFIKTMSVINERLQRSSLFVMIFPGVALASSLTPGYFKIPLQGIFVPAQRAKPLFSMLLSRKCRSGSAWHCGLCKWHCSECRAQPDLRFALYHQKKAGLLNWFRRCELMVQLIVKSL